MRIVVSNLWSKLETDNPELLKALDKLYTFRVEGAVYSQAFKRGQWDGKKHFITPGGKFRTGLLQRVLTDLRKIGATPTFLNSIPVDPAYTYNPEVVEKVGDYVLRDYQKHLVARALIERRGIVDAPTGSGKTLIVASILQELVGKKTLILFHQKHILTQTYDFLKKCGIPDLGLCFGEGFIQGNIMLCTVQSIEKILDTHEDCEILMVDEVHEFASGKITVAAINSFDNTIFRFGFTGTVPRDKIKLFTLEGAFGPVIKEVSTSDLVERGQLAKPIIQILLQEYPELVERQYYMSYDEIYNECIVKHDGRTTKLVDIVKHVQANNKESKIMILVKNLEHGKRLHEMLYPMGSFYLQGEDDISVRYDTIKKFLGKDQSILIGTKILQTGINIEEITHFIMARGLKSEVATLQAIGRALRKYTDVVYIYDFYDKVKYLEAHSKARIKIYKREGHEVNKLWKVHKNKTKSPVS